MNGAEEDMCANKSVGDTENHVAADVKACADESADVGEKTCADETANVDETADEIDVRKGDPISRSVDETADEIVGDNNAVLENRIGIANDELGDDNVPLAPPLLHGSCSHHGSTN